MMGSQKPRLQPLAYLPNDARIVRAGGGQLGHKRADEVGAARIRQRCVSEVIKLNSSSLSRSPNSICIPGYNIFGGADRRPTDRDPRLICVVAGRGPSPSQMFSSLAFPDHFGASI
jgi:hypothetical protein